MLRKLWRGWLLWVRNFNLLLIRCLIIRCLRFGMRRVSCRWNLWLRGLRILMLGLTSWRIGLIMVHLNVSGFLDSSSLRPSWRAHFKIMPENMWLLSINSLSNSNTFQFSRKMWKKNHKTVATFTGYSYKVLDGMPLRNRLKIPNLNSSIQVNLSFILGLPMMLLLP